MTGRISRNSVLMVVVTPGMAAFLDCLQQFKEEVEKGDSGFHLPYDMEKGKIKDPSTGMRQTAIFYRCFQIIVLLFSS